VRKQRNKELHFQCTFYHQPKLKKSRLLFFNFENGVITTTFQVPGTKNPI